MCGTCLELHKIAFDLKKYELSHRGRKACSIVCNRLFSKELIIVIVKRPVYQK